MSQLESQGPDSSSPPPAQEGVLFALVGPSGAGKNTVMRALVAAMPQLTRLPTATSRPPRGEEREGVDHYFVSAAQFREMVTRDALVEYQEVHPGKLYGTIRSVAQEKLDQGAALVADIDVNGAQALKHAFPGRVVSVFVAPPSLDAMGERLRQRGGMTDVDMQERLARAAYEMSLASTCDYQVVNDTLERCIAEVGGIISQELRRRAGETSPLR